MNQKIIDAIKKIREDHPFKRNGSHELCYKCAMDDLEKELNQKTDPFRIWWIPQIPSDESFYVAVNSVEDGILLLEALANYDLWQLEHNIKPDYSNAGGLQVYQDGEWVDYEDEEGRDIDEIMRMKRK